MTNLINAFYNTNIIKHTNDEKNMFLLKSGKKSSTYIDFRILSSYPSILKNVCKELNISVKDFIEINLNEIKEQQVKTHIVGVPTGGYSLAQTLSVLYNYSCLMLRSSSNIKSHGLKRQLEGSWQKGDRVILVDDVITSGKSLIETIDRLNNMHINVIKAVVILCRDKTAINTVWEQKNIRVEYLFSMDDINENLNLDKLENTHSLRSL